MPYRPTERTEARRAATRDRILGSAIDQLADGGYASASVQAIATRAEVATGTVYRHFPSKSDLFAEAFRHASARELAVVAEVAADDERPARERMAAAVEAFARRALASPTRAYALLAEPVDPAVEAERLTFRRGYRDVFARTIEGGIAAGELPPQDALTVAAALVGALGEALVGPLSPAAHATDGHEALIATLVQFCLNAVPEYAVHSAQWAEAEPERLPTAHCALPT
jgi:AcrR family transcriptional regulator